MYNLLFRYLPTCRLPDRYRTQFDARTEIVFLHYVCWPEIRNQSCSYENKRGPPHVLFIFFPTSKYVQWTCNKIMSKRLLARFINEVSNTVTRGRMVSWSKTVFFECCPNENGIMFVLPTVILNNNCLNRVFNAVHMTQRTVVVDFQWNKTKKKSTFIDRTPVITI